MTKKRGKIFAYNIKGENTSVHFMENFKVKEDTMVIGGIKYCFV